MKKTILIITLFCNILAVHTAMAQWVQKASYLGGKIRDVTSFSIGDYAYVGTGSCSASYPAIYYSRHFYRYDPSLDVWKNIADLPSPASLRIGAAGFSINSKGYVCGGEIPDPFYYNILPDMWEYDPETNFWYQRTNFPRAGGISNGSAFSIGSKGYVGLGSASSSNEMNDFYEYDPQVNKWTKLGDFPGAPREGAVGFSMNGKGYVGLGRSREGGGYVYYKDFWEYNPLTDNWTRLPDFPGDGRQDAIGYGVNGCCYVGLGAINDFYKYDMNSKEWTIINYLPGAVRFAPLSFCAGSNIYYGCGSQNGTVSDVWEYSIGNVVTGVLSHEIVDFKCYPNPATDKITLQCSPAKKMDKIELVDIHGELMNVKSSGNRTEKQVDISRLTNGIYFIKIISGNEVVYKKIVKE